MGFLAFADSPGSRRLMQIDMNMVVVARGAAAGEAHFAVTGEAHAVGQMRLDEDAADPVIINERDHQRLGPRPIPAPAPVRRRITQIDGTGLIATGSTLPLARRLIGEIA